MVIIPFLFIPNGSLFTNVISQKKIRKVVHDDNVASIKRKKVMLRGYMEVKILRRGKKHNRPPLLITI